MARGAKAVLSPSFQTTLFCISVLSVFTKRSSFLPQKTIPKARHLLTSEQGKPDLEYTRADCSKACNNSFVKEEKVTLTSKLHCTEDSSSVRVPQVSRITPSLQRAAAPVSPQHSISKLSQDPHKQQSENPQNLRFGGARRLHPAARTELSQKRDFPKGSVLGPCLQEHGSNNAPIFQFQ